MEPTALRIHLNQERCHSDLSRWNGHVEEEDRDPCVKEVISQRASLHQDFNMISESMENRNDTKGLRDSSEKLLTLVSTTILLRYRVMEAKLIPKRRGTVSMPWCRIC